MARKIWPWAWTAYLSSATAAFAVLEWLAYRHGKHPTLSRELRRWTGGTRCRWSSLVFTAAGAWLSWHVASLKDDIAALRDDQP